MSAQSGPPPLLVRLILWAMVAGTAGYFVYAQRRNADLHDALLAWLYAAPVTSVGIITVLGAGICIGLVATFRTGRRPEQRSSDPRVITSAETDRRVDTRPWYQRRAGWLVGLMPLGMFGVTGVHVREVAIRAGELVPVDAAALERGAPPGGSYVAVSGRLLRDRAVEILGHRSGTNYVEQLYIPIVSPDWRPGQPVRVFLDTSPFLKKWHVIELGAGRWVGMLRPSALPSSIRGAFGRRGLAPPENYWVLNDTVTPTSMRWESTCMIGGGVFGWLLIVIPWTLAERRRRLRVAA